MGILEFFKIHRVTTPPLLPNKHSAADKNNIEPGSIPRASFRIRKKEGMTMKNSGSKEKSKKRERDA